MSVDISKQVEQAQRLVGEFNKVLSHNGRWKGNKDGQLQHFAPSTIVPSVKLDTDAQKLELVFDFAEVTGQAHRIEAVMPFENVGKSNESTISLDGVAQQESRVHVGHREGLEGFTVYARLVVEFLFTDAAGTSHNYRFDGDLI